MPITDTITDTTADVATTVIPQHKSQLVRVIAGDAGLLERIRGVVAQQVEAKDFGVTERTLYDEPPLDLLGIKVATNPAIFGVIDTALAQTGGNIATAIQVGLADNDLTFVVCQELPGLAP